MNILKVPMQLEYLKFSYYPIDLLAHKKYFFQKNEII
jgi:hypothetical protein